MKKLAAASLALLVLVGCSDAYVTPQSNEVLFTVAGKDVKEKQLFEVMKRADGGKSIIAQSSKDVSKDIDDAGIEADAQKQLEEAKTTLGADFAKLLANLNFESEQQYVDEIILPGLKMQFMVKAAIDADFATLVSEYKPKQARILETVDATKATEALAKLKAGTDFETVATEFANPAGQYKGATTIYNMKGTQFPSVVSKYITVQESPVLSDVLTDEQTGKAYIVEVVETQADRYKDELLKQWSTDAQLTAKYRAKIFTDNKFKVFDKVVYDALAETSKDLLGIKEDTTKKSNTSTQPSTTTTQQ